MQLTTSLHRNVGHQSEAALHKNSGRSDSGRREGARGNGLVPDKEIRVTIPLNLKLRSSGKSSSRPQTPLD